MNQLNKETKCAYVRNFEKYLKACIVKQLIILKRQYFDDEVDVFTIVKECVIDIIALVIVAIPMN